MLQLMYYIILILYNLSRGGTVVHASWKQWMTRTKIHGSKSPLSYNIWRRRRKFWKLASIFSKKLQIFLIFIEIFKIFGGIKNFIFILSPKAKILKIIIYIYKNTIHGSHGNRIFLKKSTVPKSSTVPPYLSYTE